MSHNSNELLKNICNYEKLSLSSLVAEAKKKEKKKLDPKAKVRNRGTVCVPAERAKDKKDHFPINDEDQARNALARVHQYTSAPPWYGGSLKGLQSLVSSKVHAKYPGIGKSDKKKKSFEVNEDLLTKYSQDAWGGALRPPAPGASPAQVELARAQSLTEAAKNQALMDAQKPQAPAAGPAPKAPQVGVPQAAKQPAAKPHMKSDPWITALQKALMANKIPLPQFGADGKMGRETHEALKQFFARSGRQWSGKLDPATVQSLQPLVKQYLPASSTEALVKKYG